MPKTPKDWIAMFLSISNLLIIVSGHLVPSTWIEGISAWRFLFVLFMLYLIGWAVDRYIIAPIRELKAAISKMEEAARSLTVAVGTQYNSIEASRGKIEGTYDHIWKSLNELLSRIPPPPRTGA
jgi:UDP-N-acetylmuramyl pentapeptide phosphotransferase/UDP-N-acetylglucosamine-1-phosphate transferase